MSQSQIPANAKQRCPDLEPLSNPADMAALHSHDMDVIDSYNECAARHDALIAIVGASPN